jgi:dephospho-CoA kinase
MARAEANARDLRLVHIEAAVVVGKLKLVGLTGGIGSGKSTVARLIAARGIPVIDADVLSREVMAPGQPAYAEIAAQWPDVIVTSGDQGAHIDRRRLAARVFSDPAARARLEAITHPRIQARMRDLAAELARQGHRLVVYEASLLVEAGRSGEFDAVVVVTADEEQQLQRTMARDGSTREHALARLRAQLPLAEKVKLATHLVDNSGDLESTRRQVDLLLQSL